MTEPPALDALDALDDFTVFIDYGRAHTTFNIHADGGHDPVARMHKDAAHDTGHPYRVCTGPEFDCLAGYVTPFSAMSADNAEIGTVRLNERVVRHDEWTVTQHGLGALTGLPAGLNSRLRHGSPLRLIPRQDLADVLFSVRLRFRGPQSPGFELARRAGVRARYAVRIHDPRISRLLVLACVLQFNTYASADPLT
jgi:hypothetical protein